MSTKNKIEITRENKNLGWAWKQWTPNDPEPPTEPDYGGTLSHVLNRIYWDRAFQCAKNAWMLDYMRAVYCMHPMVLDALDYIDSIESRIAELKAFIDQLIEAGDDIADDYCNDTLTPYGLQIVKNWQALIKDWKER